MLQSAIVKTLFFLSLLGPLSVGAMADDISSQYRMLEWKDLVPEGWEPPLVPPGHGSEEATRVPAEAVIPALDEVRITLPGYMKPIVFEENRVSAFLLVPFLPHHTKQHAHLDANQMVYVSTLEPILVENPFDPIWVVGTLSVDTVMTDEGPAAYRIGDAVVTEYTY